MGGENGMENLPPSTLIHPRGSARKRIRARSPNLCIGTHIHTHTLYRELGREYRRARRLHRLIYWDITFYWYRRVCRGPVRNCCPRHRHCRLHRHRRDFINCPIKFVLQSLLLMVGKHRPDKKIVTITLRMWLHTVRRGNVPGLSHHGKVMKAKGEKNWRKFYS